MRLVIFIAFMLGSAAADAQYSRHIIRLRDKKGTVSTLGNPSSFLSAKAISRRTRFSIALDSTDLPVSSAYLDSIRKAGAVTILSTSKWLNQVLIRTTDATALARINAFPFVRASAPIAEQQAAPAAPSDKFSKEEVKEIQEPARMKQSTDDLINYGSSYGQIHIHEGEYLHNAGFRGQGITIAVLDAGFRNYLSIPAFDSLRRSNRILGEYDYVVNESSVNEDHPHGMNCFSIMGANLPGTYVGSAPGASYYLFRTEDDATEYPVEEHNWVVAAEAADSLGADMISSSLGYYLFDNPVFHHRYADMNGNTTMVTIGADLAAKKGMIVCNSAGNQGSDSWRYIIAPADGDSVLAVGAVNVNGDIANFSSWGPSSDGNVKPDVASVGWGTIVINTDGTVAQGSGTSFSNPNMAGLIACLWQAFPEFSNMQILEAVKKSSSKATAPDDRVGYGIPNMRKAYQMLLQKRYEKQLGQTDWFKAFPNPVQSRLTVIVKAPQAGRTGYQLIDANGRLLDQKQDELRLNDLVVYDIQRFAQLPRGVYFIRMLNGNNSQTIRVMKQ
jgi:subtilisin family serine protease